MIDKWIQNIYTEFIKNITINLSFTVQIKSIFIMANIRSRKERIIEPIDNVEDQIDCSVKKKAGQVNTTDEFVIEDLRPESLKVEDDAVLEEGEHYEKR